MRLLLFFLICLLFSSCYKDQVNPISDTITTVTEVPRDTYDAILIGSTYNEDDSPASNYSLLIGHQQVQAESEYN